MLAGGIAAFALAYGLFTLETTALLALPFLLAGVGIGAVEDGPALALKESRGSAFGMLATVRSVATWLPTSSAFSGPLFP
ncbi:hypothetical protein [Streptomyces sp. NPDC000851]